MINRHHHKKPLKLLNFKNLVRILILVTLTLLIWQYSIFNQQNQLKAYESQQDYHIAVLLQKSPVDVSYQIERLKAIDVGWASWNSLAIKIYACLSILNDFTQMQNIDVILTNGSNPMEKMMDAFVHITLNTKNLKWFVFANDHTFMILPNLKCFLKKLNPNELVYTGNILGINMRNGLQTFASGAAGAILSHVSLKSMLILWALEMDFSLRRSIDTSHCLKLIHNTDSDNMKYAFANCINVLDHRIRNHSYFSDSVFDVQENSGMEFLETLLHIMKIRHQCRQDIIPSQDITINLSELVVLRIHIEVDDYTITVLHKNLLSTSLETFVIGESASSFMNISIIHRHMLLESNCIDSSTWGLDNPGIMVAICLQNLLAAAFPNSEEHVPCLDTSPLSLNHEHKCIDYNGTELHQKMLGEGLQKTFFTCNTQQERFNVYGPVRSAIRSGDEWYLDMKRRLAEGGTRGEKDSQDWTFNETLVVAPHMISFHYVAKYESTLLFQILAAKQLFQQQQQTSSLVVKIVPWRNRLNLNSDFRLCSANDLLDIWPSSTAQLGGYGRRLKGKGEAELLFHLLFHHIKIYDSTCSD